MPLAGELKDTARYLQLLRIVYYDNLTTAKEDAPVRGATVKCDRSRSVTLGDRGNQLLPTTVASWLLCCILATVECDGFRSVTLRNHGNQMLPTTVASRLVCCILATEKL
jgi:hypothetical protein